MSLEYIAKDRVRWMPEKAKRCLRSEGFTETSDCYDSDFDDLVKYSIRWSTEEHLTDLGIEVVKILRNNK